MLAAPRRVARVFLVADGVFVMNTGGDMTTCLVRQQQACVNNATAPGTEDPASFTTAW
jgi:hypothetical protein